MDIAPLLEALGVVVLIGLPVFLLISIMYWMQGVSNDLETIKERLKKKVK